MRARAHEQCINLSGADDTEITDNHLHNMRRARFSNATETLMTGNYGYRNQNLEIITTGGACFARASDAVFVPKC